MIVSVFIPIPKSWRIAEEVENLDPSQSSGMCPINFVKKEIITYNTLPAFQRN